MEFSFCLGYWGYDYGFCNGRENMDTQVDERMLPVARIVAGTAAVVLGRRY
jgi:hypothetical protein